MPHPQHSFAFQFDLPFIRRALRRDRNWGVIKVVLMYAVLVPGLVWVLDMGGNLVLGMLGGGLVATVTLVVALFHVAAKKTFALWQQQSPSGSIRYELDDEGFTVQLDHATAHYQWQGLRRLWRYPDVWLLEILKNTSAFFPPEGVPEAAKNYIVARCEAAGARV